MVENAIAFDKISKEKLSIAMREITDLDNLNRELKQNLLVKKM